MRRCECLREGGAYGLQAGAMRDEAQTRVAINFGSCHRNPYQMRINLIEKCGSFPAPSRAGNSNRTFGLLCDVARGVK